MTLIRVILGVGLIYFIMHNTGNAQTSLWKDHNPYANEIRQGALVEINVNENFMVDVHFDLKKNGRLKMNLSPDTSTLKFVKPSSQSKAMTKSDNDRFRVKEKLQFKIAGIIGKPSADGQTWAIRAVKNIIVNSTPTQVVITGKVNEKSFKDGSVDSAMIADFNMAVSSKQSEAAASDLKISKLPGTSEDEDITPANTKITQPVQMKYYRQYLDEIFEYFR